MPSTVRVSTTPGSGVDVVLEQGHRERVDRRLLLIGQPVVR